MILRKKICMTLKVANHPDLGVVVNLVDQVEQVAPEEVPVVVLLVVIQIMVMIMLTKILLKRRV